jgi:isoleucyl-tRNA synthetase
VIPRLVQFVDSLTNWYVRLNRKRMKGDMGDEDRHVALTVLFEARLQSLLLVLMSAPG